MKHLFVFTLIAQLLVLPAQAQSLNDSFEGTKPLTDAEQNEANNYFHAGRTQKVLEEECAKLNKKYDTTLGCTDESGKPGQVLGGNLGGMLEEMLPKLYATMGTVAMATGGGSIKMKPKEGQSKDDAKKKDICIYIPMAGEVVASGMQMMNEKKIESQTVAQNGADIQKESLYAVARTHDSRAKTATIQGGVYGATAACYIAYVATGAVVDVSMGLKLAAAGTMSYIFFKKAGNHKKYAEDVRNIAKKLPGAGDCNPHTQTNCFCSEPTSRNSDIANFNKVCVPQELARNTPGKVAIPCSTISNGNAQLDAECKCKKSNSCLNNQIANLGAQVGFGGMELADPLRMLNGLNGELDEASVQNFGSQLAAKANKLASTAPIGEFKTGGLKGRNKDIADALAKAGMPGAMAAYAASQQAGSANSTSPGVSNLEVPTDSSSPARVSTRVGYGYGGSSGARKSGSGMSDFKNPMGAKKPDAIQIDTFAEQAVAQAEITKDTSVGIFDLISNRYRRSAWSRFEMDKLVQEVPAPTETQPTPAPAAQ